ncbi:MAG: DUF983 domain-containing protein [Opitutaceae bacterium]
MKIERAEIITRSLTGRCPNCGEFGMFKHWFRLNKRCTSCDMQLEKDESGFYFGTTSIGYVLAIIVVIIPVCVLVVMDILEMWTGIAIGILGSVLLCVLLYPFMLCWVIMSYFAVCPQELPENSDEASK